MTAVMAMAPSIVMAASTVPTVMVAASATSPAMAVAVTVAALHENHRFVLYRERVRRRRPQPG